MRFSKLAIQMLSGLVSLILVLAFQNCSNLRLMGLNQQSGGGNGDSYGGMQTFHLLSARTSCGPDWMPEIKSTIYIYTDHAEIEDTCTKSKTPISPSAISILEPNQTAVYNGEIFEAIRSDVPSQPNLRKKLHAYCKSSNLGQDYVVMKIWKSLDTSELTLSELVFKGGTNIETYGVLKARQQIAIGPDIYNRFERLDMSAFVEIHTLDPQPRDAQLMTTLFGPVPIDGVCNTSPEINSL